MTNQDLCQECKDGFDRAGALSSWTNTATLSSNSFSNLMHFKEIISILTTTSHKVQTVKHRLSVPPFLPLTTSFFLRGIWSFSWAHSG